MHHTRYLPVMLPLATTVDGHYYAGRCCNARVARWDATSQQFFHFRIKFGGEFVEAIRHEEYPGDFDKFIPVFDITTDFPREIPYEDPRLQPPHPHPLPRLPPE